MSLVINTNSAATAASVNLNRSNALLQKSLSRLSSGSKITSPADDAGGLAVSMKLTATIMRTDAVSKNVANAVSFLQTQDGALKTASTILSRISELRTLRDDVTKSSSDLANYDTEFQQLKAQLSTLALEQFNGVSLFGAPGSSVSVPTTEDGNVGQAVSLSKAALATQVGAITSGTTLGSITIANVSTAIQNVATLRASNGAQASRLSFASDMLSINKTNLEAANSRIIDTDVATESTQFARYSILVQSGAAMLAQANTTPQVALRLLS